MMAFVKDGGYCPRCDTVWASSGKCRCEMREHSRLAASDMKPTEPISYSGTLDSFDRAKVGYDKMDDHEKAIWNAAIETAAKEAVSIRLVGVHFVADQIRKLKK